MFVDPDTGLQPPLTHTYKHLGIMVSLDGQLAPAVAQCVAKYRAARAPIGRTLRRARQVPPPATFPFGRDRDHPRPLLQRDLAGAPAAPAMTVGGGARPWIPA